MESYNLKPLSTYIGFITI